MSVYRDALQVVQASGLWDNGRGERNYGFVLSPDVYEVTTERALDLSCLGVVLHNCLAGLGRMAAIAAEPTLGRGNHWQTFGRLSRTGTPKEFHAIQTLHPGRVPVIYKVDFMESIDGELFIVEIDAYNKRGLGYAVLAERLQHAVRPDAKTFSGVVPPIMRAMHKQGKEKLVLAYADKERFYDPTFRIFSDEMRAQGAVCAVLSEFEASRLFDRASSTIAAHPATFSEPTTEPLLVDLPFFDRSGDLGRSMAEGYAAGKLSFLMPPKPFLGSKGMMALLSNPYADAETEAMLAAFIPPHDLHVIRRYLPQTYLVTGNRHEPDEWVAIAKNLPLILKATISSGMKGVSFPEDPNYTEMVRRAAKMHGGFVLQQRIWPKPMRFSSFRPDGTTEEGLWYTRITAHFADRDVVDVAVTARKDVKVHGAPDGLEMGSVIVP